MTVALIQATIRHERRVRLAFSQALASGAFTSVSYYSVASIGNVATPPNVVKAYAIVDGPNVVELQFDGDLVQGAPYRFTANGVPAVDTSVTPTPSTADARMAREPAPAAAGAPRPGTELEEVLFGRDLRWTGSDFAERPGGDLDDAAGREVLEVDLTRRVLSDGLAWDPTFGAKSRDFVDAPAPALGGLRGRVVAQMRQDDRITDAVATVDVSDPGEPILEVTATPVGAALLSERTGPISLRAEL